MALIPYVPASGLEAKPLPLNVSDASLIAADPVAGASYAPTRLAQDPRTTATTQHSQGDRH